MKKKIAVILASALLSSALCVTAFGADTDDHDKIGEEYDGIVSSVTNFGMFVELDNTVEGLVRFETMTDEYYRFDESQKMLIGEKTKKMYRIGDKVRIRVIEANKVLRKINFELITDV